MATKELLKLYSEQYYHGEWKGPWWYQVVSRFVRTREEVVASMLPNKRKIIVDLGCGEGYLLQLCSPKSSQLIGLDAVGSRLALAKKKVQASNVSFRLHDLDTPLPFESNSIDTITLVSVLEYIVVPDFIISEIYRVLKHGGICVIEVPNIAFLKERLILLFGGLPGTAHAPGWQGGRLHHFTYTSLRNYLLKNNFKIIKQGSSGLFSAVRNFFPDMFASDIIFMCKKV